jgi:hypothetical protein
MEKEKLIEIVNYLKISTEGEFEYHEDDIDKIIIGTYDGGYDSGFFNLTINPPNMSSKELGDFETFIEEKLLFPEYGSFAFEGNCNGVIYYDRNADSFKVDGSVSYEEWRGFTDDVSIEELIKEM